MTEHESRNDERSNISPAFPMYKCYPADHEGIVMTNSNNTQMQFPETNRHAIMSALKNLQDKISQLEKEKNEALSNLNELTTQTHQKSIQTQTALNEKTQTSADMVTLNDISDLNSKLNEAEQRCMALDQQLNDLKKSFGNQASYTLEDYTLSNTIFSSPNNKSFTRKTQGVGFKNGDTSLKRERERLCNVREHTERKIKELESELQQEKRYRQLIEEKSLQLNRTGLSSSPHSRRHITHHNTTLPSSTAFVTLKSYEDCLNESMVTMESYSPRYSDDEVGDLLFELKAELTQLENQQDEMQHMMINATSPDLKHSLKKEIYDVKTRVGIKEDQINRVVNIQKKKNHWNECKEDHQKHDKLKQIYSKSAMIPLSDDDRKVQVLTTITASGRAAMSSGRCFRCDGNNL